MEEANHFYLEQGSLYGDDVSASTKWGILFQDVKHSTVSMARNANLSQYKQLFMSLSDFQNRISQWKIHIPDIASRMKCNLDSTDDSLRSLVAAYWDLTKGLVRELREKIAALETVVADRDREIGELRLGYEILQEFHLKEKTDITNDWQSDVKSLEARVRDTEARVRDSEARVRDCEAKREREKKMYEEKQRENVGTIKQLKANLSTRCGELKKLSKDLVAKKTECEMLMLEKNEQAVQMQKLGEEMQARISQLEVQRDHLEYWLRESTIKINEVERAKSEELDQLNRSFGMLWSEFLGQGGS